MATTTFPELSQKLTDAYAKAQRELAADPEMAILVWDEALTRLQGIDFQRPDLVEFVEAHACISSLEQVLVAVAGRSGGIVR